jgi:eukaryotic-like serine/threonine-protein kinase
MGEVWKARDTRLDRMVAIKTSKVEFNDRFEREARAVSALNHPHICQLYDVGPDYLVMEWVDGSPLKGPIALDQALALAIQLAGAMDAAHRNGITHRDLKPANVLVTKSGVKVLDFGIAKIERAGGVAATEDTSSQPPTHQGTILGTLQYMAPEQLQAKEVDGRADIFSFGCILYEILTGNRAFDGQNAASVIAAVMEQPAPPLGRAAPASLDRVVKRCLEKDPDDRWQTARDLQAELVWIAGGRSDVASQAENHPAKTRLLWPAVSLLAAVIAAVAAWMLKPAAERPVSRTEIVLGPDEHFANLETPAVAISPDSANIAYVASRADGPPQLFLRPMDALKAEPIAGTEGAASPFFARWPVDRFFRWSQAEEGVRRRGRAHHIERKRRFARGPERSLGTEQYYRLSAFNPCLLPGLRLRRNSAPARYSNETRGLALAADPAGRRGGSVCWRSGRLRLWEQCIHRGCPARWSG